MLVRRCVSLYLVACVLATQQSVAADLKDYSDFCNALAKDSPEYQKCIGYSGEAGRVFRSYSATQNDSGRPPAKGHARQP